MLPLSRLSVLYWFPPHVSIKHLLILRPSFSIENARLHYSFLLFCPPNSHSSCLSPHPLTSFSKDTEDEGWMLYFALPGVQKVAVVSNSSSRKEVRPGRAGGRYFSERSSWGRDLAHAKSLLLHQVDRVRIGAPIILWVIVLSAVDQCRTCSRHVGDLRLGG